MNRFGLMCIMETEEHDSKDFVTQLSEDDTNLALNKSVINYYKQFGKRRNLEQYFSLSTVHSDVRDPSGVFWKNMKAHDSSDSGDKRSESSTEVCRISIKCSIPQNSSSSQVRFSNFKIFTLGSFVITLWINSELI